MRYRLCLIVLAIVVVGACESKTVDSIPLASALTRAAVGHYCHMIVIDHPGPKAQIHLRSTNEPMWFSSVRDAIAFTRLPEEPNDIVAIYVHDMSGYKDWKKPPGKWININDAVLVIDSGMRGGMGAREAVPFSSEEAAAAFIETMGGRSIRLDEIPDDYILGSDIEPTHEDSGHDHSMAPVPDALDPAQWVLR